MIKKHKRHFLLLEVLIAIFLVSLCILPLLAPYTAIFRDQQRFADKISIDHATSLLYADMIEKLYQQAIPWEELKSGASIPIDSATIQRLTGRAIPWSGSYRFAQDKDSSISKPKEPDALLSGPIAFTLIFTFKPKASAGLGKEKKFRV